MKNSYYILIGILLVSCSGETPQAKQEVAQMNSNEQSNQKTLSAEHINAHIKDDPNNPNNYNRRSLYHFEQGNYSLALDDIERAIKIAPSVAPFYFTRGKIYQKAMRLEDAKIAYDQCLLLDEKHIEANIGLAKILLINSQYNEAMRHINTALKENKYVADGYYLKGLIYLETGDSLNASRSFQTTVEQNSDHLEAYNILGLMYANAGNDLAIEYYNTALSIKPQDSTVIYNLAKYYQDTDRYNKSVENYNRLIHSYPNHFNAHFNLGYIFYISGSKREDLLKSIDYYTSALTINPKSKEAFYNRGLVREELGKVAVAKKDYELALSIDHSYTPAARALSMLNRK